jgi:hypothetical protein
VSSKKKARKKRKQEQADISRRLKAPNPVLVRGADQRDFIRHRPAGFNAPAGMMFLPIGNTAEEDRLAGQMAMELTQGKPEMVIVDSLPLMASGDFVGGTTPKDDDAPKIELYGGKHKHCDDYLPYNNPECLVWWILIERLPAWARLMAHRKNVNPACFATHKGKRVRLVMASRMGDVGITTVLGNKEGPYETRVWLDELTDFSETP